MHVPIYFYPNDVLKLITTATASKPLPKFTMFAHRNHHGAPVGKWLLSFEKCDDKKQVEESLSRYLQSKPKLNRILTTLVELKQRP